MKGQLKDVEDELRGVSVKSLRPKQRLMGRMT